MLRIVSEHNNEESTDEIKGAVVINYSMMLKKITFDCQYTTVE